MADQINEATEIAWDHLVRARHSVLSTIEGALKRDGLPPLCWYECLRELERAGGSGLRPVALEKSLLLPQYGLSRLLSRIEAAGFVERRQDPKDARAQTVHLTAEGQELKNRMHPVYVSALRIGLEEKVQDKQARKLAKILKKIL